MPVVHHQRLTGYTACGRPSLGLLLDDYDPTFRPGQPRREVTCRTCLRSLARQPRAADLVFAAVTMVATGRDACSCSRP